MTMATDISKMSIKLAVIGTDINHIKKVLDGNGEPGLVKDTRANTNYRIGNQAKAKMITLMFGSGWLLVIILIILSVIGII